MNNHQPPRSPEHRVLSAAPYGYHGELIEVEADVKAGLPTLQIVGMGNKAIDEARQRVRSAVVNASLPFPAQKVVVNLAPAELPKDGTQLDVPIALSILLAHGKLHPSQLSGCLFVGELALDGSLRPIRGAIVITETAQHHGLKKVFLPAQNAAQAALVGGVEVIPISHLSQLYQALVGAITITPYLPEAPAQAAPLHPSIDSIIGHEHAKRALAVAAAGRHNLLLSGPPGTGKTMLAHCLVGLLPPLSPKEVVEVTKLHSLSLASSPPAIHHYPPLRAPHHSATLSALIGGGLHPQPGEISLAHKGVLFLDELPEYPRATLEALRQPIEAGVVHLSRLYQHIQYPADFLLIATMNPCPCGYSGNADAACRCGPGAVERYQAKLSGPLLDRIDIRISLSKVPTEHIFSTKMSQSSQHSEVLDAIVSARTAQKRRYKRSDYYNSQATLQQAKLLFAIAPDAQSLLQTASTQLRLSTRGSLRVLRVARTIADLQDSPTLDAAHIAEALQYRR